MTDRKPFCYPTWFGFCHQSMRLIKLDVQTALNASLGGDHKLAQEYLRRISRDLERELKEVADAAVRDGNRHHFLPEEEKAA